ncbi:MAG: cytochrome c [Verrucomicrobia bacterium]|nr:cytochrome c [Verrucomicrobiota bacterium]
MTNNLCALCGLAVNIPILLRTTFVFLGFLALGSGFASADRLVQSGSRKPSGFRLFDQAGQADGQKIFQTRCFVCHGRGGKGDGPSAAGLAEKPQDLTDANWQRSTTDERIRSVIQGGGAAIGKTGAMPPNPDLTQEQIQSLVAFVRSLAAK